MYRRSNSSNGFSKARFQEEYKKLIRLVVQSLYKDEYYVVVNGLLQHLGETAGVKDTALAKELNLGQRQVREILAELKKHGLVKAVSKKSQQTVQRRIYRDAFWRIDVESFVLVVKWKHMKFLERSEMDTNSEIQYICRNSACCAYDTPIDVHTAMEHMDDSGMFICEDCEEKLINIADKPRQPGERSSREEIRRKYNLGMSRIIEQLNIVDKALKDERELKEQEAKAAKEEAEREGDGGGELGGRKGVVNPRLGPESKTRPLEDEGVIKVQLQPPRKKAKIDHRSKEIEEMLHKGRKAQFHQQHQPVPSIQHSPAVPSILTRPNGHVPSFPHHNRKHMPSVNRLPTTTPVPRFTGAPLHNGVTPIPRMPVTQHRVPTQQLNSQIPPPPPPPPSFGMSPIRRSPVQPNFMRTGHPLQPAVGGYQTNGLQSLMPTGGYAVTPQQQQQQQPPRQRVPPPIHRIPAPVIRQPMVPQQRPQPSFAPQMMNPPLRMTQPQPVRQTMVPQQQVQPQPQVTVKGKLYPLSVVENDDRLIVAMTPQEYENYNRLIGDEGDY